MLQGLKSNNKVKINLFLAGGIIFILIGTGLLGLVQKVSALTYTYDFSLEPGVSRWAYKKIGDQPENPTDPALEEASSGDYTNISSNNDNDARWETVGATGNKFESQIYTFTISEDIVNITSLTLNWEGYGETAIGFFTSFYIWDNTSGWEELDSIDFTSTDDAILTGNITSNLGNYIDPVSKLTIMAVTQREKQLGEPCSVGSECASGYCVDGVCCDSLCGGDCEACNLSGTEGTCTLKSTNEDVITTCYYCNGVSGTSVSYSGDEGVGCTGDCTHCVNGSCDNWGNNEQREGCTGICEACQSGSCSSAIADTDPGSDCGTSGCYTGNCNSSGACDWYTSGERNCSTCQACDAGGNCVNIPPAANGKDCNDDCTYCSAGICEDRLAGATDECSTCQACDVDGGNCAVITAPEGKDCNDDCTSCVAGTCTDRDAGATDECTGCQECGTTGGDCVDDDVNCTGCESCSSGSCVDDSNNCSDNNCYTGNCESAVCTVYTSGERNCSTCQACDAGGNCVNIPPAANGKDCNDDCTYCLDGSCEYREIGDNTECPVCQGCDGYDIGNPTSDCSDFLTEGLFGGSNPSNTDTAWGGGLDGEDYGCMGPNKRCVGGVCKECLGAIFPDGFETCINCVNQGGKACWHRGGTVVDCDATCIPYGGCINKNWDDDPINCSVCRHWYPGSACYMDWGNPPWVTELAAPYWEQQLFGAGRCHLRPNTDYVKWDVACDEPTPLGGHRRFCVCEW